MQYILENAYTKKLFEQLKGNASQLKMLTMAEVITLEPGHRLVIDEEDLSTFYDMQIRFEELIVLSKRNLYDLKPDCNVRYVKKYQSTRNILTLITKTAFPLIFLVFATKNSDNDSIIEDIRKKYDIDTIISLDFSPNSSFSLFDTIAREEHKVIKYTILEVITNMQDYLNPPTADLILFINRLKEKNRLLVVSAPLKGALDSAFMELADTIILVENDKKTKLELHLRHRLKSKCFEVIEYDELSRN